MFGYPIFLYYHPIYYIRRNEIFYGDKSIIAYPAYKNFETGKHELFPVPLSELQSNPLLEGKNNPGYE